MCVLDSHFYSKLSEKGYEGVKTWHRKVIFSNSLFDEIKFYHNSGLRWIYG